MDSLIANNTQRNMDQNERRGNKPGKKMSPVWWIVAATSIVLAVLLVIFQPMVKDPVIISEEPPQAVVVDTDAVPPPPAPIPAASNPRAGIGVERQKLVTAFSARPYRFDFREGRPVNDESNYLGYSRALPRASVQILGRPDDIAEIAINNVIEPDTVWKVAAESAAMQLARVVDVEALPWIKENFLKIRVNKSCFASKEFARRQWTISYSQLGPEGNFLLRVGLPKQHQKGTDGAK